IVHRAAPAPGPPGTRAAFVRTSVTALLNLLDAATAWGVPRVSLASSLGVYQGVPDTPYREDAHLRQLPVDPIPAAKNAAELLAAIVTQSAGPQGVNLGIATLCGPGNASRAPAGGAASRCGSRSMLATDPTCATWPTAPGRSPCCSAPKPCLTRPTTSAPGARPAPRRSGTRYAASSRA